MDLVSNPNRVWGSYIATVIHGCMSSVSELYEDTVARWVIVVRVLFCCGGVLPSNHTYTGRELKCNSICDSEGDKDFVITSKD